MKLRTIEYAIRETFLSLRRNSWMTFASIGTVAVSLFILGMFLALVVNINRAAEALESQVTINVYLVDELKAGEINALGDELRGMQGISTVAFVDKAEAMTRFRQRLGDQKFLIEALGESNPLPNSFEVTVRQPDMVKPAARKIEGFDGVEEVKYGQDVVEHLFSITRLIRIFGLAIMLLLAGATLFIISNTIRLTVFARRKEIAIMKYVGATDWFIRGPFMLEGIVLGALGGVVASLALRFFYAMVTDKIYDALAFFPLLPMYPFMYYLSVFVLVCGMVIGALGSVISLKRFLEV